MDLSVIEQSPRSRNIYTQLCFCYQMTPGVLPETLVEKLTIGLRRLTCHFPWLAGQVINEGASEGDTGVFSVVPFSELPQLVVKDHTKAETGLTMQKLLEAGFPFSMLREEEICPRSTLSDKPGDSSRESAPVLILQANFIHGGMLLSILVSHITMDIVGQVQMIRSLSKACRNEPFTEEEVHGGNLDRRNIIPLLDEPEFTRAVSRITAENSNANTTSQTPPQRGVPSLPASSIQLTWTYFRFSTSALTELKDTVSTSLPSSCDYISTDDAICALTWSGIGRARILRLPASTSSTFIRQVDVRRMLNIPAAYLGNVVTNTTTTLALSVLTAKSLGDVAALLRSELNPDALRQNMKAFATKQLLTKNKAAGSTKDRSEMVVTSSWSKTNCYDLDFDLGLGRPVAVRRPAFSPLEGVVYYLPKAPDGEILVGLCLRADDLNLLKQDTEFLRFCQPIE